MKHRLVLTIVFLGLWGGCIVGRLFHLQVVRHDHYVNKAARQQERVIQIHLPRGVIYDRTGRELAVSLNVDSLFATPWDIHDPEVTARSLAGQLGLNETKLATQLAKDREFVWVKRKLQPPESERIRNLHLSGIGFLQEPRRYYPHRGLAAQVLGFVGMDDYGLAGLELLYEEMLAGGTDRLTVIRDGRHQRTIIRPPRALARQGQDLRLTLDIRLQYAAEAELAWAVEASGARSGCAILLDPRSGSVLAMANYPGFNPNEFWRYPVRRWRNRAISDMVEPGSLLRVVASALVLEDGNLPPETLRAVLSSSHPVPLPGNLYQRLRDLGFGGPTGIDLPGESSGMLSPALQVPQGRDRPWSGEGIGATPIQLATALSAIVSGGVLRPPHLLESGQGSLLARKAETLPVRSAVSRATSQEIVNALLAMSRPFPNTAVPESYPVAGIQGRSREQLYFFGFMPVENPALTGLVVINSPQASGEGLAAEVFGAMVKRLVRILKVLPEGPMPQAWPAASPAGDGVP